MNYFISFLQILIQVLSLAVLVRAILSWFPIGSNNPLTGILHNVTEPILAPLRRIIPRAGMLDLTPLIAILLLQLISYLLTWA